MSGPAACGRCGTTAGPFTTKRTPDNRPICEDCETPEDRQK